MVKTPTISRLVLAKDARLHERFARALEILNAGIANKRVWNVELNDAKFILSNGVERALQAICDRWRTAGKGSTEDWTYPDFSGWCSFNQAAGRIRRLTRSAPRGNKTARNYIAALSEVDAIWKAIQAAKPFVAKGRRPNENKTSEQVAAELWNTGICAICDRRQKLDKGRMVHHGFQMSEYNHSGNREGRCFGTGHKCYEFGNEANVALAPVLAEWLEGGLRALKTLKSGTVETLTVTRRKYSHSPYNVILRKGTPEFDQELASQVAEGELFVRSTRAKIKANDAKIKGWSLRPLAYGGGGDSTSPVV